MNQSEANTIYELLRTLSAMGVFTADGSEVDIDALIEVLRAYYPELSAMIGLSRDVKNGGEV